MSVLGSCICPDPIPRNQIVQHLEEVHFGPRSFEKARVECRECPFRVSVDRLQYMIAHCAATRHGIHDVVFSWNKFLKQEEARLRNILSMGLEIRERDSESFSRSEADFSRLAGREGELGSSSDRGDRLSYNFPFSRPATPNYQDGSFLDTLQSDYARDHTSNDILGENVIVHRPNATSDSAHIASKPPSKPAQQKRKAKANPKPPRAKKPRGPKNTAHRNPHNFKLQLISKKRDENEETEIEGKKSQISTDCITQSEEVDPPTGPSTPLPPAAIKEECLSEAESESEVPRDSVGGEKSETPTKEPECVELVFNATLSTLPPETTPSSGEDLNESRKIRGAESSSESCKLCDRMVVLPGARRARLKQAIRHLSVHDPSLRPLKCQQCSHRSIGMNNFVAHLKSARASRNGCNGSYEVLDLGPKIEERVLGLLEMAFPNIAWINFIRSGEGLPGLEPPKMDDNSPDVSKDENRAATEDGSERSQAQPQEKPDP